MTADVVPFPQIRRRRFIMKTVERLANLPSDVTTQKTLTATVNRQAANMARKGIAPEAIERERKILESVLRAELWNRVLLPDGAA
jgi:hypothetical protein